MKKWEQEQKIKAHHSRLKNAKAAVSNTNSGGSSASGASSGVRRSVKLNGSVGDMKSQIGSGSIRSPLIQQQQFQYQYMNSMDGAKGISDYYESEKLNLASIPLFRILRLQNLQQYAKELISRGFGYDLKKFNYMSQTQIENLLTEIKVLPGHRTKLIDLLDLISNEMIPEIENDSMWNMETPQPTTTLHTNTSQQSLNSGKSIGKSHSTKIMGNPTLSSKQQQSTGHGMFGVGGSSTNPGLMNTTGGPRSTTSQSSRTSSTQYAQQVYQQAGSNRNTSNSMGGNNTKGFHSQNRSEGVQANMPRSSGSLGGYSSTTRHTPTSSSSDISSRLNNTQQRGQQKSQTAYLAKRTPTQSSQQKLAYTQSQSLPSQQRLRKSNSSQQHQLQIGYEYFAGAGIGSHSSVTDGYEEDDGYDEFQDAIESLVKQYTFKNNRDPNNQQVNERMFDRKSRGEIELSNNIGMRSSDQARLKFDSALNSVTSPSYNQANTSATGISSSKQSATGTPLSTLRSSTGATNSLSNAGPVKKPSKDLLPLNQNKQPTMVQQQQQQMVNLNISNSKNSSITGSGSSNSISTPTNIPPLTQANAKIGRPTSAIVKQSGGMSTGNQQESKGPQREVNLQQQQSQNKVEGKDVKLQSQQKHIQEGKSLNQKTSEAQIGGSNNEEGVEKRTGRIKIAKPANSVQDDICLIPEFDQNDKLVTQFQENRLIKSLRQKLSSNAQLEANSDELNPKLDYEEIKQMYLSYEGGKLTSTLVNLDIEEMCFCFACAILTHIQQGNSGEESNQTKNDGVYMNTKSTLHKIDEEDHHVQEPVTLPPAVAQRVSGPTSIKMPVFSNYSDIPKFNNTNLINNAGNQQDCHQADNSLNRTTNPIEEPTMIQDEYSASALVVDAASKYLKNVTTVLPKEYQNEEDEEEDYEQEEYELEDGEDPTQNASFDADKDVEVHWRGNKKVISNLKSKQPETKKSLSDISEHTQEISHRAGGQAANIESEKPERQQKVSSVHSKRSKQFESNRKEIEEILKESMLMKAHKEPNLSLQRRLGFEDSQHHPELEYTEDEEDEHDHERLKPRKNSSEFHDYQYLVNNPDTAIPLDETEEVQSEGEVEEEEEEQEEDEYDDNNEIERLRQGEDDNQGKAKRKQSQKQNQQNVEESSVNFSMISRYSMVLQDNVTSNRRLFEKTFNLKDNVDVIFTRTPTSENVQSYCKNICISCQLEKQIPIIALVYIERLLEKSGFTVTNKNWRKIAFIAMVMASKIWDDESFENDNFAQACPQYTVIQINEMERVFLNFIDYNLYVKGADYAKYYFILRGFAQKNKKSFPLRPLDLKTILFLQNNANRMQHNLREAYADPLNKSF